jgi:predicted transcriptional regulator
MAKTLTIQIRSIGEALEGFKDTFKAAEVGGRVREREGVYFTSMEAARNLLTPNRLALLRAIRTKRPGSIYELAKMVHRDLKNVQGDLKLLERYGLVRMSQEHRKGKRQVTVPRTIFRQIALKIAI